VSVLQQKDDEELLSFLLQLVQVRRKGGGWGAATDQGRHAAPWPCVAGGLQSGCLLYASPELMLVYLCRHCGTSAMTPHASHASS
jgi:hypothetical protein